ncbi:MAG: class I SAM-dependent methyltransferase [Nocardioides sp.]|nr:class I SAM-dependent methyltransferase [Nocardioides sp.]
MSPSSGPPPMDRRPAGLTHPSRTPSRQAYARSFGGVADAYDRARPSYPADVVAWLLGDQPRRVLELGAGTGKLTGVLLSAGHEVLATEPDPAMVERLVVAHPDVAVARAGAEQIPAATRAVDAVVVAQALHWFDLDAALPEMARVLRPGGTVGLVWNIMDTRIPWVRRLRTLMDAAAEAPTEDVAAVEASGLFAPFEAETFRFWQPLDRESLGALVSSVSAVAVRNEAGRAEVLAAADALYDEYGRGHDGMLLPYVTYAYRSTALAPAGGADGAVAVDRDDVDTDSLLIDFR